MPQPVSIIGVGAILPHGIGDAALDRVLEGRCAAERWPADPRYVVGRVAEGMVREVDGQDRAVSLALLAAEDVLRDAGVVTGPEKKRLATEEAPSPGPEGPPSPIEVEGYLSHALRGRTLTPRGQGISSERFACVYTVSKGAIHQLVALAAAASRTPHPDGSLSVLAADPAVAARAIADRFGLRGPVYAPVTACASGGHALAAARDLILDGRADAVLCGAADASLHELILSSYARLGLLAAPRDDLSLTCRPFAADRDGFYVAEGAAAFVVTSPETARRLGLRARADLIGAATGSLACDLVGVPHDGKDLATIIERALADAGLAPAEIDLVHLHATATKDGDLNEARAIYRVFGASAETLPMLGTKPLHGHFLGAACAVESAVLIRALEGGVFPAGAAGTRGAVCGNLAMGVSGSQSQVRVALKVAAGFGGQVSVNVFSLGGR